MRDRFGVEQLYPTVGTEWTSNWDNGHARQVKVMKKGRNQENPDPDDRWADFHCHSFKEEKNWMDIDGAGVCRLLGPHPRLHIHKPNKSKDREIWRNTEMTCYCLVPSEGAFMSGYYPPDSKTFQRATSAQFDLRSRTNHHLEHKCRCNGLGYISSMNVMKNSMGFRKEIIHGYYANVTSPKINIPRDKWFGHKFILRDYDNGTKVKLEKYLDLNGNNTWVKYGEKLDTGSWAVTDAADKAGCKKYAPSCKKGCVDKRPPGPPWNKIILRAGRDAYLRTDFSKNIQFSRFSIREIASL